MSLENPHLAHESACLVQNEQEAWTKFLGKKIEIPEPPQALFDTLKKAKEISWYIFDPHYLPKLEFKKTDDYPGWNIKPNPFYWDYINIGGLNVSASFIDSSWVLIDKTQKPYDEAGLQIYANDPLGNLIGELRYQKKILGRKGMPMGSRFAISWEELHQSVLLQIAKILALNKNQVRLPKVIEFNLLGNVFYPEWGRTDTAEWFEDKIRFCDYAFKACLIGGISPKIRGSGLSRFFRSDPGIGSSTIGFRPMIVFPPKS